MLKCCLNCKFASVTEDDLDDKGGEIGGMRKLFQCRKWLDPVHKQPTPVWCVVLERESNPEMKIETSFMPAFHCCYWEPKGV